MQNDIPIEDTSMPPNTQVDQFVKISQTIKRRLEEEAHVSDMVAVAAGSRPYSMKTEEPATLQQLVKESQPSPGFWDSFIKLK